jgi:hypothetical protein
MPLVEAKDDATRAAFRTAVAAPAAALATAAAAVAAAADADAAAAVWFGRGPPEHLCRTTLVRAQAFAPTHGLLWHCPCAGSMVLAALVHPWH